MLLSILLAFTCRGYSLILSLPVVCVLQFGRNAHLQENAPGLRSAGGLSGAGGVLEGIGEWNSEDNIGGTWNDPNDKMRKPLRVRQIYLYLASESCCTYTVLTRKRVMYAFAYSCSRRRCREWVRLGCQRRVGAALARALLCRSGLPALLAWGSFRRPCRTPTRT